MLMNPFAISQQVRYGEDERKMKDVRASPMCSYVYYARIRSVHQPAGSIVRTVGIRLELI